MSFTEFTRPIQIKFHQFCHSFADDFSRPVHKFIYQMIFGILKGGNVQLNSIARSLQENISLKKVTQRLGAHLSKAGFWKDVTKATLQAQASQLRQCRFVIVDLSDISKAYAQKMPGLAGVYDGSKKEIGLGYNLCNITAVSDDGLDIVPAYSELFSHTAESTSENQKILHAVDEVMPFCAPDATVVIDRGGDRQKLFTPLLQADRQFIVRQEGNRHLFYQGEKHDFEYLTQKAKLNWTFTVERIHRNKVRKLMFDCGAIPVQLTAKGQQLWLVVMKERKRSYCWLLCYFKGCQSAYEAVSLALKGYGLRWKIEEVHRQIKVDYRLEALRLERYEALKTMNALLWMAASFLYTRLESLAQKIICHPELGLANRKTIKDLFRFIYYKLAAAFKKIMATARLYEKITFPTPSRQIALPLDC